MFQLNKILPLFCFILLVHAIPASADPVFSAPFKSISNYGGSYGSAVIHADGTIEMFSSSFPTKGVSGVVKYDGKAFTKLARATLVAGPSIVNDMAGAEITRVNITYSDRDHMYYGVIYVSKGYPPADSRVFPAFISSPTAAAGTWVYHGQFGGEVGKLFPAASYGSGMALIVNDTAGALDPAHPAENKFVFYADGFGPLLALLYSADGVNWYFAKDSKGKILDVRPVELRGENYIFPSAIRTPNAFHMYVSNGWPPSGHRHLVSKNGIDWTLDGTVAKPEILYAKHKAKNVSLAYDRFKKIIYVMPTNWDSFTGETYKKFFSWFPDR